VQIELICGQSLSVMNHLGQTEFHAFRVHKKNAVVASVGFDVIIQAIGVTPLGPVLELRGKWVER
jgi:hypothetical protein